MRARTRTSLRNGVLSTATFREKIAQGMSGKTVHLPEMTPNLLLQRLKHYRSRLLIILGTGPVFWLLYTLVRTYPNAAIALAFVAGGTFTVLIEEADKRKAKKTIAEP
jgi:hypothetical protein